VLLMVHPSKKAKNETFFAHVSRAAALGSERMSAKALAAFRIASDATEI
jgi:hypothetical protein